MRRSIIAKVIFGYALVIAILSLLFYYFSIKSIRSHYEGILSEDLTRSAKILIPQIKELVIQKRYHRLLNYVRKMGLETKIRITVIAPDGVVLADSKKDPAQMENHRNRPEIKQAFFKKRGISLRYSTTLRQRMLYVALPVLSENRVICVMRVSMFVKDIDELIGVVKKRMLHILLFTIILAFIISIVFSHGITRPIRALAEASKKIASAEFKTRIVIKNRDEIGRLAVAFNQMGEEIERLFMDIKAKREELEGILKSISDAILVIDREGKIILNNQAFIDIFASSNDITGKRFWEVPGFMEGNLVAKIDNALKDKKPVDTEFKKGTRYFTLRFSPIKTHGGGVFVFHDITKIMRLDRIKRDFVSNVSHELRTPLTAIKGFVETLEDEVKDKNQLRHLEVIKRHTDRLINIVEDLLILSELEDEKALFKMDKVDLIGVITSILKIYEQKATEKGIKLNFVSKVSPLMIYGDKFKLEQLFINLLDNAIKYTEEGFVEIECRRSDSFALVKIRDSGIGIPKEHLDRIFERFYRVDKSRSRKLGGTGLGLSIVKHIVLVHNGRIEVESKPKIGTTFSVYIPLLTES